MIATVLDLYEHPRQAFLKPFQQMRRHVANRHDVGDRDFFLIGNAECRRRVERRARIAPSLTAHLVVIAEHAIDLGHVGKHLGLDLRRAAGHDDPGFRPLALQSADRLPRLRHRLIGDRAAIDDDGICEPRALGLPRHHFGLEGIEAAAERDNLDAHGSTLMAQATEANSAGSKRPSYSKVAVPVIST